MPRQVLILLALGLAALGLVALLASFAAPLIAQRQNEAEERVLLDLLPPRSYDNRPLQAPIDLEPDGLLGNRGSSEALVARRAGQPVAVLLPVTATGYEGPIRLLTAFAGEGELIAVKVLEQHETPGFAALSEAGPSRWLASLTDTFDASAPGPARWRLATEGGEVDAMAGATITSRAVLDALSRARRFYLAHRDDLLEIQP